MRVTFVAAALFSLALGQKAPEPREYKKPSRFAAETRQSGCTCPTNNPFAPDASGRIVGGQDAGGPLPHQVWLGGCGGTILTNKHILSARHCFDGAEDATVLSTGFTVKAGLYKRSQSQSPVQSRSVATVYAPGTYSGITNDIVIMELDEPLVFNDDVQPACLPTGEVADGSTVYTSGWGTRASGAGSLPNKLQWVDVPVVSHADCDQAYGSGQVVKEAMFCAGLLGVGGKDSCQGDSGGPVISLDNGKVEVVGIVSWGISCADPSYPGVYTRVSSYLDWINGIIGGGCDVEATTLPPVQGCGTPRWKGDGWCDVENNNPCCDFDGGDCCLPGFGKGCCENGFCQKDTCACLNECQANP